MRKRWIASMAAASVFAAAVAGVMLTSSSPDSNVVTTAQGDLVGIVKDDAEWFSGVPFAAPPVGELRWQPPQEPVAWSGVRDARKVGPQCMQSDRIAMMVNRIMKGTGGSDFVVWLADFLQPILFPTNMSEDCLTLNIITPDSESDKKLPVMVFFHGGSFLGGGGSTSFYNSAAYAKRDTILVTVNYRLNIFGFFSHPILSAENPLGVSGNQGMLDQIAALKWVKENIGSFGGDPDNVTIFGESAGGHSIGFLMSSPTAKGLFHKGLMQSGCGVIQYRRLKDDYRYVPSQESVGTLIAGGADKDALDYLRDLSERELLALYDSMPDLIEHYSYWPIIDGVHLPDSMADIFSRGEQAQIPLLFGWNADEGVTFMLPDGKGQPPLYMSNFIPQHQKQYENLVRESFEELGDDVLKAFPWDGDTVNSNAQMFGHSRFTAPCVYLADMHRAQGNDVFVYNFDRVTPHEDQTLGAYHASELQFVFDTHTPLMATDENDMVLTKAIGDYWASFAHNGKPGVDGQPVWPAYDSSNNQAMIFTNDGLHAGEISKIDAIRVLSKWTEKLMLED